MPPSFSPEAEIRLRRLRRLAWLLDRSIGVGRTRIGLDPLIGLVPGLGDWIGGVLSLYIVYEGLRLGLSWAVLGRMLANVGVEALLGAVPLAGDVFDFWWQANQRNLLLVERHYRPHLQPRSWRAIGAGLAVLALAVIALTALTLTATVWLLRELWQWFAA